MKMMKRIGAILITIAMLASFSVCAFANTGAKVQITDVTATYLDDEDTSKDGVYTVTVDYTVEGATADTQVTMLAYIFDGRTADLGDKTADEYDAEKQDANYATFIEGAARAIDQQSYTGSMTFKLLKAAPGGAVSDKAAATTDYLLVKVGTDQTGVSSQAYFVNLAEARDENAEDEATTYTITYLPGDAEGDAVEEPFTVGEDYVLAENPFTAPDGYEFAGWSIGGTIFEEGTAYIAKGDTEVIATWREIRQGGDDQEETYTVTYKANGGVGEDVVIENVPAGDYALVGNTSFNYDGFRFVGWKVNNEGETLNAGANITLDADTVLYAQWEEQSQGGGGTGDDDEPTTRLLGDANGDGNVNGGDWQLIRAWLKGNGTDAYNADMEDANSETYRASDANADTTVNGGDWQLIRAWLKGNANNDSIGNVLN